MPSINRIRVNNVKYNFGTQYYDDFTMRMYGKNTLYDLANGGGKSVLMLLLMQNMIPNCTLDEKQPIEKLFRTGNGNTTIHSLVEWKLDEQDRAEGYRYMTTGFCARKAKEVEGEAAKKDVAAIEYFNYCIFYREYNKNDIINLPLSRDKERITFQGLRNYLKELEHRDMSLKVRIFDRKGEYQRFISHYGLHESQWEIIRGINKTEGHVRTYFETNYKTTRKVVEDLLIEGIIEKAYAVKTMRDGEDSDTMAKMLMDIKEQLTVLARKKKDIASYDHQAELMEVLRDKVASFMGLYQEQTSMEQLLADICVTGEEFVRNDADALEKLDQKRTEKRAAKDAQRKRMECLKVSRDKRHLEQLLGQIKQAEKQMDLQKKRLDEEHADLAKKQSMNEYLEYVEERRKKDELDAWVKAQMNASSFDETLLYTYAYNIKMRMDVQMTNLRNQIEQLTDERNRNLAKKQYNEKMLAQMQVETAVWEHSKQEADEEIKQLSEQLSEIRMQMNEIRFTDAKEQLQESKQLLQELQEKQSKEEAVVAECLAEEETQKEQLIQLRSRQTENEKILGELITKEQAYQEAEEKLHKIQTIYGAVEMEALMDVLTDRIRDAVLKIEDLKKQGVDCSKNADRLAEGRLIGVSDAAKKVLDYIETRHGIAAMYGMDYVSALPAEKQAAVLSANPQLVYGIVTEDYDTLEEDPNIRMIDTGSVPVYIYDRDHMEDMAMHLGDNVFAVSATPEYLLDAETISELVAKERQREKEIGDQLAMQEEMLSAYRDDQAFLIRLSDRDLLQAGKRLADARKQAAETEQQLTVCMDALELIHKKIAESKEKQAGYKEEYESCLEDVNRLYTVEQLTAVIAKQEQRQAQAQKELERMEEQKNMFLEQGGDSRLYTEEAEAKIRSMQDKLELLNREWKENYDAYYDMEQEYDVLTISDEDLRARFRTMVDENRGDIHAMEDKQLVIATLLASMEKSKKNIASRGVDFAELADLESRNLLYRSDDQVMTACRDNIAQTREQLKTQERQLAEIRSKADKLDGSIQYAIENIQNGYGSYEEVEESESEIIASLESGQTLLSRLEAEAKACDEEYRVYEKNQRYMMDLYKDVKRIVTTHEINLEHAQPMREEKEKLREMFESQLMNFDRTCKQLDRAKNELLKFKGNTAQAFDEMHAYELAGTIRDDVRIPEDYAEAKTLVDNLESMVGYVHLERDRVEKSLTDMESLKANFEEQCLQRCLDVRTELDKLPKLSRIIMDDEAIQMVGLQVPYVKDEFLKQRMSDYIDRIVAQADDYEQDRDRMKFIRGSLTLKKLYSVIVTDMNAIRLSLYKRERIREQSRYLKYEEAVGSTGQSQGIYIQFLISIINYISGMYRTGNEDTGTKTIFIDNPFGAAKDVYIWEPIFALLAANHVQLIVPARGATPAITGRFDVNYILGQQMAGGKQLTVVVDYTSKVEQEERVYQDLEYEQVSFDFI